MKKPKKNRKSSSKQSKIKQKNSDSQVKAKSSIDSISYCQKAKELSCSSSRELLCLMERAIASSSNGIVIIDANQSDLPAIFINPAFEKLTGYTSEEIIGRNCRFLQGNDINQTEIQQIKMALIQVKESHVILRNYRKDGTLFWNEVYISPVFNENKELTHFIGIQTDVTERKRLEIALQSTQERLSGILDIAKDAIISVDENQRILLFNQGAENVFGYQTEEILGQPLELLLPQKVKEVHHQYFREFSISNDITRKMGKRPEVYARRKDGTEFPAEASISKLELKDGKIYTVILRDITERKEAEVKLLEYAFYDSLTSLPNRTYFMQKLEQELEKVAGDRNYIFAILFIDLDDFKLVNDSLGHGIGDRLLIAFARRVKTFLRSSDTIARFGGDEFIILLPEIEDINDVIKIAENIHQQLQLPFKIDPYEVFTNASMGITLGTTEYQKAQDLLRNADIAMYHAKEKGKGRYAVFNRQMHKLAIARLQIETDLRRAQLRSEFKLYYQPIVSLTTGKIKAFEALLRWHHPERGLISPAKFIPVAEATGLIVSIGQWVLYSACSQMKIWQQKFPQREILNISINVSGKQLQQPDFIAQIDNILATTGLESQYLKLELTESILMENTESIRKILKLLQARGIRLSLDDFGTGYSSLSYLQSFPINTIKIDRSFIKSISSNDKNAAIVGAIITLAHTLDMDAIAEGIETSRQLDQLKLLGCSQGQGYFFAKPMPAKEVEAFLV